MKKISSLFIILFLLQSLSAISQSKNCKVTVKGKVSFTGMYKGGARPTPEILEDCCQPKPMVNTTFYLKDNYYSKAKYTITTDNTGSFSKRLRPGTYKLFLKNEVNAEKAKALAAVKSDQEIDIKTYRYFEMKVEPGKEMNYMISIIERKDPKDAMTQ